MPVAAEGAQARGGGGGRHARARELAERRARGEELDDFERRALEAHLVACPRCAQWAEDLSDRAGGEPVVPGQEPGTGATVGGMEAATSPGDGDRHVGSATDAMGQDKRREVVGHSYGPSKARQLVYYGIAIAVIVLLYIGAKIAVDELDKAPANDPAKAPWSQPDAPQAPPQRFE
jgi:hypothetical protein